MGSSPSCEACALEKNTNTKSRSYVEELLQIKHANYLNSHSMESKEVLQSRRERVLKTLAERKPVKPYAIQLLEARAAAKSELSIHENLSDSEANANPQSNNLQGQKNTLETDHRSKILQRIAARRKSKQSAITSPSTSVNTAPSPTVNSFPSTVVNIPPVKTTRSVAVNISPSPSFRTLMPPASNKATQSDPPASVLSTASQSSSIVDSVDSAIQVAPAVQSSPQQTVRLSEPKIYVRPKTPPPPKILIPPPQRLLNQPPLSLRQSISAAFSRPVPTSSVEPSVAPSQPSFCHRLENVYKEKLNQYDKTAAAECPLCIKPPFLSEIKLNNGSGKHKTNYDRKSYNNQPMEEKRRYFDRDPITSPPTQSGPGKKLLTLDEEQPLEFDSDDSCRKRHTAAVDRLTDSLMANWTEKKTSAELLGANQKELSLLTYGESKRSEVPHFPVRNRVSQGFTKDGSALLLNESLPSVKFGRNRHSQINWESRREKRCVRHQFNKNLI